MALRLKSNLKYQILDQVKSTCYRKKYGYQADSLVRALSKMINKTQRLGFTVLKAHCPSQQGKDYSILALKLVGRFENMLKQQGQHCLRDHALHMKRREMPQYKQLNALKKLHKHATQRRRLRRLLLVPFLIGPFRRIKDRANIGRYKEAFSLLGRLESMICRRGAFTAVIHAKLGTVVRFSKETRDHKKVEYSSGSNSTLVSDRFLQSRSNNYQY